LLAKISAVMEAIELWHFEQPMPATAHGTARDLAPGYPISALPVTHPLPEEALAQLVWDWTAGKTLVHGKGVLLPCDLVRCQMQRPAWGPDVLRATSTGLACGNTRNEALLHGLYEVIERDVLYCDEQSGGARRTFVDLQTVDDPYAQVLIERLRAAGMDVE